MKVLLRQPTADHGPQVHVLHLPKPEFWRAVPGAGECVRRRRADRRGLLRGQRAPRLRGVSVRHHQELPLRRLPPQPNKDHEEGAPAVLRARRLGVSHVQVRALLPAGLLTELGHHQPLCCRCCSVVVLSQNRLFFLAKQARRRTDRPTDGVLLVLACIMMIVPRLLGCVTASHDFARLHARPVVYIFVHVGRSVGRFALLAGAFVRSFVRSGGGGGGGDGGRCWCLVVTRVHASIGVQVFDLALRAVGRHRRTANVRACVVGDIRKSCPHVSAACTLTQP